MPAHGSTENVRAAGNDPAPALQPGAEAGAAGGPGPQAAERLPNAAARGAEPQPPENDPEPEPRAPTQPDAPQRDLPASPATPG